MDWVGLGLFAAGSAGAVLMCLAMGTNRPLEEQGSLVGPVAALWKNALGIFPAMFANAAIAFLGARLFLQGGASTLVRNLIGCLGLALALSVVCGAWSPVAGGAVGEHTGTVITNVTHVALGTLIGLLLFFAVAWFAWLRASGAILDATSPDVPVQIEPAPKASVKPTTRPVAHKTTAPNVGVTPAESAALFPDAVEEVALEQADLSARPAIPPSPYPEDVRRKGQVPPGARPLEAGNAAAEALPVPAVYRWTAPAVEHTEEMRPSPAAPLDPSAEREDLDDDVVDPRRHESDFEPDRATLGERLDVDEEEGAALAASRTLPAVPSPSWEREQPLLFRPEVGDEEPVDAYGTPLSLVEKLRQARRESGLEPARGALPNVEDDLVETSEDERAPIGAAASAPVLDVDMDEVDEADVFDAGDDEAFELDEDVEEALEEDEVDVRAAIPRELDALEFEPEVVASEVDDGTQSRHAALESGEIEVARAQAEFEESEFEEVALEAGAVLEPLVVPAVVAVPTPQPEGERKAVAARAEQLQTGLFDAVDPKPAATEREVVLQPVAPAPAERAAKAPAAAGDPHARLLTEIGCLFIERGRVAVSMLQRQYQMDFDDACKVLDDLQEMGLIGPYLGGQRRDILLTREQWLERVSQSSVAR